LLWWVFDGGELAAAVEKRISPLRFAPVEMTAILVGGRAWLREAELLEAGNNSKVKGNGKDKSKGKSNGKDKSKCGGSSLRSE
jgi:hypothetical protein